MIKRPRRQLKRKRITSLLLTAVLVLMLCACSGGSSAGGEAESTDAAETSGQNGAGDEKTSAVAAETGESGNGTDEAGSNGTSSGPDEANEEGQSAPAGEGGGYQVPEFRDAVFNSDAAEGTDGVQIDLSSCDKGFVGLRCSVEGKIKFQVLKDELTVTYSVEIGKDQIFPLQSGDGHYEFRVMQNITDNKYAELYSASADVVIADPFDPFLRPNQYADYDKDSKCVQIASGFAAEASDAGSFINKVYEYICGNVTYDEVKAQSVTSGYLPDPDSTVDEKKGICFDYACLAASMLRSQGVPTKIIFGYVAPNDVYHAWNKFYTEEDGWQLAEFKVKGNDWNRIDITFYANDAGSEFIGDGSNYMEAYEF